MNRELFTRHPANPILTAEDWPNPVNAVFNPAAALVGGETVLLPRVEDLRGISNLTTCRSANGIDGWRVEAEPLLAPVPVFGFRPPGWVNPTSPDVHREVAVSDECIDSRWGFPLPARP